MPTVSISEWVLGLLTEYPEQIVCLEIDDVLYSNTAPTRLFGDIPWVRLEMDKIAPETRVSKVIVEYAEALEAQVSEVRFGTSTITDNGAIAQIAPLCRDKKQAVGEILRLESRAWQHCIAFGDDYNDIGMLKAAGISVAMENGEDEIKEIAMLQTSSNNDDGVGRILDEILDS